jgi:Kef-type K+ transport system membrane component KefB
LIITDLFNVLLLIAAALIFARAIGYLFYKLKQPAVIGEIVAGILLGGIVLFFFSGQKFVISDNVITTPVFDFNSAGYVIFAEIGILFLLFISGMEISFSKLKKTEKASILVALGGVLVPLFLGIISCIFLNLSLTESIVVGLILIATSVGVTVRVLMDLHVLNTEAGATILSGAVIDDIIGILLLALVLGIERSFLDVAWIGIKIIIFFLIFLLLGLKIIDKILDIGEKIQMPKAFLSISLAILLIYSFFADKAGVSGIIGAFIAGLLIGHNIRSKKIIDDVRAIGYGFFIPIFFVGVGSSLWDGASMDFTSYTTIGIFALIIIIVSIFGKIIGCCIGAKLAGMSNRESLQVGVGMIPRMELALIIATAAISRGIISGDIAHQILVTTIILTVITTLIAPILIKTTFKNEK